jgi:hypothetical protein
MLQMIIRIEEACAVGDFVNHELWIFDLWNLALLICVYKGCICGRSVKYLASML